MSALRKKERLVVEQSDIDAGVCASRQKCVIANAVRRQYGLPGHGYVKVTTTGVAFNKDGIRYLFRLPRNGAKQLVAFDERGKGAVSPFVCGLELVNTKPVAPPSTPERRARIGELARKRRAERVAAGLPANVDYNAQRQAGI